MQTPLTLSYQLGLVGPVLTVMAAALAGLIADWFLPKGSGGRYASWLGLLGVAAAGALTVRQWGQMAGTKALSGGFGRVADLGDGATQELFLLQGDRYAVYAGGIILLSAFASLLLGLAYAERRSAMDRMEHPVILLLATAAMLLACMATDLVFLFLCIETFSIALYVLAGFRRDQRASQEAALKYFVLGAFAAGFLLYGIALVYASTGTTNLSLIHTVLQKQGLNGLPPLVSVGLGLILVGLGFKVALAPFHQWTPDVYDGAPLTVTAFMATGTKVAAFAALGRVLWSGFSLLAPMWAPVLAVLAVVTLFLGNLVALVQADMKRMLAYSAVAQSGYLLIGLLAGGPAGRGAMLFYLLAYTLMTLGAFAALVALGSAVDAPDRDATRLADLRGLGARSPAVAVALGICLVSLAGLPPTAGFLGKWTLFDAALGAGRSGLAVALILGSVISAFTYLRPLVLMVMGSADEDARLDEPSTANAVVLAVCALLVAGALVLAGPLAGASRQATMTAAQDESPRPGGGGVGTPQTGGGIFMAAPPELDERMRAKAAASPTP